MLLIMVAMSSCKKEATATPEGGVVNIYAKNKGAIFSVTIKNSDSLVVKSYNHNEYLTAVDSIKDKDYPYLLSITLHNGYYAMKVVCKVTGSFVFKTINVGYTIGNGNICEMHVNY